jgi:hypothetical protein
MIREIDGVEPPFRTQRRSFPLGEMPMPRFDNCELERRNEQVLINQNIMNFKEIQETTPQSRPLLALLY